MQPRKIDDGVLLLSKLATRCIIKCSVCSGLAHLFLPRGRSMLSSSGGRGRGRCRGRRGASDGFGHLFHEALEPGSIWLDEARLLEAFYAAIQASMLDLGFS